MKIKNNIITYIGTLSLLISACTNTNCVEVKAYYSDNSKKLIHVYSDCNDTLTYIRKHFYQNGQISSYGHYINNKREGEFKSWYENGNLSAIWDNENGLANGKMTCYREDEKIERIGNINNGTGIGYFKFFDQNESIIAEGELRIDIEGPIVDSLKVGEWTEYYPNGSVESLETFKDKKLNGPLKSFYRNGNLENEFFMVDDTINGLRTHYDSLGIKRMEGVQYGSQKIGDWRYWDEEGNLEQE